MKCWNNFEIVICKMKCGNNFKIISKFYFKCNQVWNRNKIISAAERVLKLFRNYLSNTECVGKHSWARISLWNNFEIISSTFASAEIKWFQVDVDEFWNNSISHVTTMLVNMLSDCPFVCTSPSVCPLSVIFHKPRGRSLPHLQLWCTCGRRWTN